MQFYLLLLLFCLICPNSFAQEEKEYTAEISIKTKLPLKDVVSIDTSDSSSVETVIENGEIFVTGLSQGIYPVYIKYKDSLEIIYINIKTKKIKLSKPKLKPKNYNEKDKITGYYTIQSSLPYSKNSSFQTTSNIFYYSFPLVDGRLNIGGDLNFNTSNFSALNTINFQNISARYVSDKINLDIGNTVNDSVLQSFNLFSDNINGVKLNYKNELKKFSVFGGVLNQPLNIYSDIKQINRDNRYIVGASFSDIINSNIFYSVGLTSKPNLFKSNENQFSVLSNINYHPFDNLLINIDSASDFSSLIFSTNSSYKLKFSSKDIINFNGRFSHIGKSYLRDSDQNSFSLSTNLNHSSGINATLGYNQEFTNNLSSNSFNLSLNKSLLENILSVYSIGSFQNNNLAGTNLNMELGSNINIFLPFTLSYRLTQFNGSRIYNAHSFNGFIRHFKLGAFSFNSQGDLRYLDSKENSSLSSNISFQTTFSPENYYGITLGLFNQANLSGKNSGDMTLGFDFGGRVNIFKNQSLNLRNRYNFINFNSTKRDDSFESNIFYTYNFENTPESLRADLKGIVFEDINNNGIYDISEPIIENVNLNLNQDFSLTKSDKKGYVFKNLEYGEYILSIDDSSLPKGYKINQKITQSLNIDKKDNEINFPVSKSLYIKGTLFCGTENIRTLDNVEIILDDKFKYTTDFSGTFNFKVKSGKHTIRINVETIPEDCILDSSIIRDVNVTDEDIDLIFSFKNN